MRRKIRVTFPKLVQEVLQIDQEYFNLKKETLYNLIIEGLGFQEITSIGVDIIDEKRSINFNLNEKKVNYFLKCWKKVDWMNYRKQNLKKSFYNICKLAS